MTLMGVTVFDGDTAEAIRHAAVSAPRPVAVTLTPPPVAPPAPGITPTPPPPVFRPNAGYAATPAIAPAIMPTPGPTPHSGLAAAMAPAEPVEAEYQGAYFCGNRAANLNLKLFQASADSRRRGLFTFGPQATSPDVPRGSFVVEGILSVSGGDIVMKPNKWVAQPGGYPWFGLSGRSDDGGKTFSGRITDSVACSVFTFKRLVAASTSR